MITHELKPAQLHTEFHKQGCVTRFCLRKVRFFLNYLVFKIKELPMAGERFCTEVTYVQELNGEVWTAKHQKGFLQLKHPL